MGSRTKNAIPLHPNKLERGRYYLVKADSALLNHAFRDLPDSEQYEDGLLQLSSEIPFDLSKRHTAISLGMLVLTPLITRWGISNVHDAVRTQASGASNALSRRAFLRKSAMGVTSLAVGATFAGNTLSFFRPFSENLDDQPRGQLLTLADLSTPDRYKEIHWHTTGRTALLAAKARDVRDRLGSDHSRGVISLGSNHDFPSKVYLEDKQRRNREIRRYARNMLEGAVQSFEPFSYREADIRDLWYRYLGAIDVLEVKTDPTSGVRVEHIDSFQSGQVAQALRER